MAEKIKGIVVRRDGATVVETEDSISILHKDGKVVKINAKTGKEKK